MPMHKRLNTSFRLDRSASADRQPVARAGKARHYFTLRGERSHDSASLVDTPAAVKVAHLQNIPPRVRGDILIQ